MNTYRLSKISGALVFALGLSTSVLANTTTSSIKGQINSPEGAPAAGTVITITHVPSGSSKKVTVNEAGSFASQGLRVGGPYRIVIDSNEFEDQTINEVYLTLGETFQIKRQLASTESVERIEVSGRVMHSSYGSNSPSSNFDLKDLQNAPTVNRDIKDVVRVDPRVYINENNSDAIQCAGGNPRFNSLTVDGMRMNDNFGLNSSGYPTERIPFSYDAIAQVAVELAPFDVQYGGFTSCNINAVTKSGDNEVHGGFFYDYTSDSLKGDSIEGDDVDTGSYDETRMGFNIGLPLIKDKLFFYAAYEELDGSQIFQYSPFVDGKIDQATVDHIRQVSMDTYDYDPGTMLPSLPVEDEKLLVKLDWNINEAHRASFVYNYNDGFSMSQSDAGSSRLSLSNHFYERGAELNAYVGSLYSDWSDNFSTEMRFGYSELENRQISRDQASDFGEFSIRADNGVTVYLGPDDSRQSNKLSYDNLSLKLAGTYYLNDHELYFGYEREELDVYNLFIQHTQGEHRFSSIEDYENGLARVYYGNAVSHNPNDAAGEFKYALNTTYIQDKFQLDSADITLTVGLRYDWYTSDDTPTHNQNFEDRYGFSNQQNLDGVDLLQPRFGLNWVYNEQLEIRGGFGLYSGGNPNVWISNSYSNDGISIIQENDRDVQLLGADAVPLQNGGKAGYDIPTQLYDAVSAGGADDHTNVTDPNFEIPSEWKYSIGATYVTEDDYIIMADFLYTDKQDSAIVQNLADEQVSTAPDGRPVYDSVNHKYKSDFMLTNVDGDDGKSSVVSLSVSKSYDNGFDFSASYAYTDAKDVSPMTSSIAFSNYQNIAVADPENPGVAASNYEIPHRFTLNMSYTTEFFAGYETKFNLFGQANQGHPYTYAFDSNSGGLGYNDADRQLLYVPLENDPNVVYGDDFDLAGFNDFIDSEGLDKYRGEILPRNRLQSDWWVKFDVRVEQEFAGFMDDHKGSAFFVIENVGNLINDDWGVLKEGSFLQGAVVADINDSNQYEYNEFTNPSSQSRATDPSLWEMRVGVKYQF
jgi:hypothetical protein